MKLQLNQVLSFLSFVDLFQSSSHCSCISRGNNASTWLDQNSTLLVPYPGSGRPDSNVLMKVEPCWLDNINRTNPFAVIHYVPVLVGDQWTYRMELRKENILGLCVKIYFIGISIYINLDEVIGPPPTSIGETDVTHITSTETNIPVIPTVIVTKGKFTGGTITGIVIAVLLVMAITVIGIAAGACYIKKKCTFYHTDVEQHHTATYVEPPVAGMDEIEHSVGEEEHVEQTEMESSPPTRISRRTNYLRDMGGANTDGDARNTHVDPSSFLKTTSLEDNRLPSTQDDIELVVVDKATANGSDAENSSHPTSDENPLSPHLLSDENSHPTFDENSSLPVSDADENSGRDRQPEDSHQPLCPEFAYI